MNDERDEELEEYECERCGETVPFAEICIQCAGCPVCCNCDFEENDYAN
jgi:hypothetical protein